MSAQPAISVVIPVLDGASNLEKCLTSLTLSDHAPVECIVIDDGSADRSANVARRFGVKLLATGGRRGPAAARNLGAAAAQADVLLFLDADVCVHADTLSRVATAFQADNALDAVIGSYDDTPVCQDLVSSYKNLQHSFVHQHGRWEASTFWAACGAIRRAVFLEQGGFAETYRHPAIEDIELGYRLVRSGRKLVLDPRIQVKHLKAWSLASLIRTDVFDRGIPWTELILRDRRMPNDLNLTWSNRASVALAFCLAGAPAIQIWVRAPRSILIGGWAAILFAILALNQAFYRFLAARRGWRFAAAAAPLDVLYHFYSGISFLAGAARYVWRSR